MKWFLCLLEKGLLDIQSSNGIEIFCNRQVSVMEWSVYSVYDHAGKLGQDCLF
jgi:hypothetical protein